MDYEKKYKEALEIARQFSEHPLQEDSSNIVEYIFPELQESKDERIRKEIIETFKNLGDGKIPVDINYADIFTWLEKQGEPVEINPTEFDTRLQSLIGKFDSLPKEELIGSLSFWLNVVQNDGTYKADEKQGEQNTKQVSIWKHWKDGIAGNGDGEPIYLIKNGYTYSLSSCLSYECDYIELSELDKLMIEKQGEQKPFDYENANIQQKDFAPKVEPKFKVGDLIRLKDGDGLEWTIKEMHHDGYYTIVCEDRDDFIYLDDRWELVGKLVDKNGPKFHEGEWVVYNNDICQIVKREEGCNKLVTTFGIEKELVNERNLSTARLWTIKDAKDGDVLSSDNSIFIFQEEYIAEKPIAYCGLMNGCFIVEGEDACWTNEKCYPATKEQRDTLLKAMADAGWEFDFEKKELKKIHMIDEDKAEMDYCFTKMMNGEKVTPAWSEDDEEYNGEDYGIDSLYHAQRILEKTLGEVDGYQTDDGILSHKCAISAVKKLYGQKSATWSKEDENHVISLLERLEGLCRNEFERTRFAINEDQDWLKSLKDKVQPQPKQEWSEEDKDFMYDTLSNLTELKDRYGEGYGNVGKCIDWLKILKQRIGG